MKRHLSSAVLLSGLLPVVAQTSNDSIQDILLDEASVIATRATQTTPIAFTNISREQLSRTNHGQDIPYLVSMTPSVVSTSDAGAGIGYTSLRIRGVDATRINVTANGIPANDAESHTVFWVNMPDLASSVKDIQLQRGVGTSTNGAGAFGASMNLQTADFARQPYAEISASGGSFRTHKETLRLGTGLLNNHWTFDLRLSNIGTSGYIDRASADLNSFYTQLAYVSNATTARFIAFGGTEETYHAWNYASREEMEAYGRRYNSCGYMFTDADGIQHFYDDQTDNYAQTNYQLLVDHRFSNNWKANFGLHYTKGDGYYQEYKTDRKLIEYGMQPYEHNGELMKRSDLVRKKAMDNHFAGAVFSLNYNNERLRTTLGGAANRYMGDHFGKVLWVKNYIGSLNPNADYYRNDARKDDANVYVRGEYLLLPSLTAYADLQYRHIHYTIEGTNDKYNSWTSNGMQRLDLDERFNFFNPKVGLHWKASDRIQLFASVAQAHKEPTRNNYTDGYFTELPRAERLTDYELGANYTNGTWHFGANLYWMDYKDQLVLTGELNEIGEAVSANVPKSYRAGVELQGGVTLPCGFEWTGNLTLSKNRIKDFQETIYGYDDEWNDLPAEVIHHGDTHIAFSPEVIANNKLSYTYKGWRTELQTQYVGEQYMSNANVDAHKLDAYCVSNLDLSYTFLPKRYAKSICVGVTIYNLFNEEYENNGWASSSYLNTPDNRVNYTGYAAQAGTNFLAHLAVKF
ncbi:MAG: TonB-dependent receptor [Bacteroidaceae bacterium]|nr:TonB-dependent receptor [Bacteroidaceae bacterium]